MMEGFCKWSIHLFSSFCECCSSKLQTFRILKASEQQTFTTQKKVALTTDANCQGLLQIFGIPKNDPKRTACSREVYVHRTSGDRHVTNERDTGKCDHTVLTQQTQKEGGETDWKMTGINEIKLDILKEAARAVGAIVKK